MSVFCKPNIKRVCRVRRRRESGVYLVFFAIAFLAFWGLVGIAIDNGNLDVIQRDMQRSGDAAALGGGDVLKYVNHTATGVPGESSSTVCTQFATMVVQTAQANGFNTWDGSHACTQADKAHCYGTYLSSHKQRVPGSTAPSAIQYDVIFFDTNAHPGNGGCGPNEPWQTELELVTPVPVVDVPAGSDCATYPYNCVEVFLAKKTPNYIMNIFGFRTSTVVVSSIGYGQ